MILFVAVVMFWVGAFSGVASENDVTIFVGIGAVFTVLVLIYLAAKGAGLHI